MPRRTEPLRLDATIVVGWITAVLILGIAAAHGGSGRTFARRAGRHAVDRLQPRRAARPPAHEGPTTAWRAATQRRRRGIADDDCADLGRYLARIAACGITEIGDRGFGYPVSRIDGQEWNAELHRAAEPLDRWVRPARRMDTDDDRQRILGEAKQGWRWIADNLSDLWD